MRVVVLLTLQLREEANILYVAGKDVRILWTSMIRVLFLPLHRSSG
jgi:hypothetical protein